MQPQQLIQVAVLGFVVGVVMWLVMVLMRDVLLSAIPCGEASKETCAQMTSDTSAIIASLFASVVGLLGLVKMGVYRPILVVIASLICLWSIATWTSEMIWFEAIAWYGILYAVFYSLFSWLVRPRSLIIVFLITIPAVVLVRLVTML